MIFVTVGTHEQPFDRLISRIDELKGGGVIREDVFIQTGFSTYEPRHCRWSKLIPYSDMVKNMEQARLIITHGGPASFLMSLQLGKIPVVVPRQSRYGEHINDHQIDFCREVAIRHGNIILVEDVDTLADILTTYDTFAAKRTAGCKSNNAAFNERLTQIVGSLCKI